MTTTLLDALGCSYDVGQTVTLKVVAPRDKGIITEVNAVENFGQIQEGDLVEAHIMVEVPR